MSKKFVLSFILFALFALNMNAQVSMGVKGGLNVSKLKLNDELYASDNKSGFFIGPMLKFTVPVIGLSFDVAALYDQKEATIKASENTEGLVFNSTTVKQKYIDIPVNVRYGFGLSSLANVFLFAGPQWGINVGDSEFKWNSTESYSLKKATFSVNVGAGVTLLKHLQASVNYNIECKKNGSMESGSNSDGTPRILKGSNNTWQVAIGYWF